MFSSNYILEPRYTRNWTTLLDMDNFTIFAGFVKRRRGSQARRAIRPHLTQINYLNGFGCEQLFIRSWLANDPRQPCYFTSNYMRSAYSPTESSDGREAIANRVRIVHMDHIKRLIRTNLTTPKTVFVSLLSYFDSDWQYFREAMRADKTTRFARNYNKEDTTSLSFVAKYGFTAGLHPWLKDNVPRRLKTPVSSGMLGLWRKWKAMRIEFHEGRRMSRLNLDHSHYAPLSLNGSDVYLVFALFLLCVTVSSVAFASEVASVVVLQ